MVCLQSNSSQVATADVLGHKFFLSAENSSRRPRALCRVKGEQIEWLKKRNAAPSTDKKCKLREAGIKALPELIW